MQSGGYDDTRHGLVPRIHGHIQKALGCSRNSEHPRVSKRAVPDRPLELPLEDSPVEKQQREARWELRRPELSAALDSLHRGTSPDKWENFQAYRSWLSTMISRLFTPEARAVGSDTLGRAWLRVRADCQNTTWRFLAVANTNWEPVLPSPIEDQIDGRAPAHTRPHRDPLDDRGISRPVL